MMIKLWGYIMKEKNEEDISGHVYDEVISKQLDDGASEGLGSRLEEAYTYFNVGAIKKNVKISQKIRKEGQDLIRDRKIALEKVSGGYLTESQGYACKFSGTVRSVRYGRQTAFPVSVTIDRNNIIDTECSCDECSGYYYYYSKNICPYVSAMLDLVEDYTSKHGIGDATDAAARQLLSSYSSRMESKVIAGSRTADSSVMLEPRIIKKDDRLVLSFKVGMSRMFVVKDLVKFVDNVKAGTSDIYGSDTSNNHRIENITQSGSRWLDFIKDATDEEKRMRERIMDITWGKRSQKIDGIELYGWRMDRLFETSMDTSISFEDKDLHIKSEMYRLSESNPKLTMNIKPEMFKEMFDGISVSMKLPYICNGTKASYYIDNESKSISRMSGDFYDKLKPFFGTFFGRAGERYVDMSIGRKSLSDFYYSVIPEIRDYVDIVETDVDIIEQYLAPLAKFSFYLDAPDGDVTCRARVRYGEKEFSCLDQLRTSRVLLESYRQGAKEKQILTMLEGFFPESDPDEDIVFCGGDEDRIFEVVTHGVEELAALGDVFCTKRFKSMNVVRRAKVSVGVSVSSGLLDLDVKTDELSQDELIELLKHYRGHQRYYRFKSGEYIDLNEESLQMLFEMMETMKLSPKDFVEGKMHLPMYRTLYLDKMLEEHDEVYNTRDKVFREIVKNMKTVNDSDYNVPDGLEASLRKYQKMGFRWIRTLEANGFGGILADDMGLGKTLQAIAVILSAKEEGRKGTSLIVAPASLVYNWADEFARFAPALKVVLVSGKQEDRSRIIEKYETENADVLVTSYDLLKRDINLYEGKVFEYEIIDEAQYIKNQTTAAAKAVKLIKSKAKFALTGTPIENRLSELWSIFDYLMPGFLYGYDTFKNEFEAPIVKYQDEEAKTRLQKMVRPFILRRLKKDVLKDLPEKLEENRIVKFDDEQQKLYDAQVLHMKNELISADDSDFGKKKLEILAQLTRLRQICCDPRLCYENYNEGSAKLESCMQLIQSAIDGGHRMLLFSQFTSMLELIEKRLIENKTEYYKITGETTKAKRIELVKQFNEGSVPVFLISLKAGGVGLNLVGADMVIHYDPWWNVAVQNQATDRAHRIGQTKKVTVYKMVVKDTIEEKIIKLQESKRDLADSIISGDNVGMSSLGKAELMELLGV